MQADKRIIKNIRHEWVLKAPAHYTEVEKAVAAAINQSQLQLPGARVGDIFISSEDDELIIVSFTVETGMDR